MTLTVSEPNNVKIYSITSASKSAIPEWLAAKNKKSLKNDIDYQRRIELIQDFQFPEASLRIKSSKDGKHIVATGTYKPQIKVFEVTDLSMKFERHTDAENVQFQILSDDWTKMVFLQNDRTIEFHTQFGMHFKTRIPKFGRDIAYHSPSCDLITVGASNEVYRLNLEQGKFLTPLVTDLPSINACQINPLHQLYAFGGENSMMEFWHPQQRKRLATLNIARDVINNLPLNSLDSIPEITKIEYAQDGLTFAVGVSTGQVLLYDLRKPEPILIKDHQYGYPIKSIHFHNYSRNVISSDTKIVKIWSQETGDVVTNIEQPNDVNDTLISPDSGLLMVANEGVQIQSFFIPSLGPAPKWCPFLDNLTEELEENPNQTIYDDYKFVTRKELNNLSLDHLVGTNLLKAYMHGFFVDLRLYEKAQAVTNPFDYETFKKTQIQKRIEKERSTRISVVKKMPRINKHLAEKMQFYAENGNKKKKILPNTNQVGDERFKNPTGDERFKDLFNDHDFEVDETTLEYRLHHPSQPVKPIEKAEDGDDSDQDQSENDNSKSLQKNSLQKPQLKQSRPISNNSKTNQHFLIKNNTSSHKSTSFSERLNEVPVKKEYMRKVSGNASITFGLKGSNSDKNPNYQERQERSNGRNGDDPRKRRGVRELNLRQTSQTRDFKSSSRGGRGRGRGRGRGK